MSSFTMKANSKGAGDEAFESAPAGNHPAVLIGLINLGTHNEPGFGGKPAEDVHKIMLVWELPTEKKSGSTANHTIGKEYRWSLHEKAAFRKMVEQWRGRAMADGEEFDPTTMLGKRCLLSVTQKPSKSNPERSYAKVDGVAALPKGMTVPEAQNKPMSWSFGDGPIPEHGWLPRYYGEPLKDVIERSKEWKALNQGGSKPQNGQPAAQPVGAGASSSGDDFHDRF